MSGTAAARRPVALDDLAAGLRHFLIRAGATARDPFALVLLAFAGVVTIPAWIFGVGIDFMTAAALPVRRGAWFTGQLDWASPAATLRMTLAHLFPELVLLQLAWVLLVATAVQGALSIRRSTGGGAMPALPVGRRTRLLAEASVALAFVAAARVATLLLCGESVGHQVLHLYRWHGVTYPMTYPAAVAVSTLLGVLFGFPMVLGWMAVTRFDLRGVLRLALAVALILAAASFGIMAHAWSALLICVATSALVLVRLDDGSRRDAPARRSADVLRPRPSPGPLQQFRRDAWLGPVKTLWLFALLVIVPPLALAQRWPHAAFGLALVQALALAALPFFPLGLKLVPPAGHAPFSGYFVQAWSVLPVGRQRVTRAVYFHGLIASATVWLVGCAQVALRGGGPGFPVFELPAVFLAGAILLCEAVGDRTRGLLAVACLVGFQMVLPVAFVFLDTTLTAGRQFSLDGPTLAVAGYALGLLGGLPPLVHLRRGGSR